MGSSAGTDSSAASTASAVSGCAPSERASSSRAFTGVSWSSRSAWRLSQARKPGIGDNVAKTFRRGNSVLNVSTTRLISESPKLTPFKPGWVLLME
ncbi:MAG: hypothetical protein BWX79_02900 [Alphaproteobacteria bacterium ADurb.Bin100]|nr:MAG: hypothetical protein BWX79_02900 [Alphaproteobacteria bacterium ADurb.Bin100]